MVMGQLGDEFFYLSAISKIKLVILLFLDFSLHGICAVQIGGCIYSHMSAQK